MTGLRRRARRLAAALTAVAAVTVGTVTGIGTAAAAPNAWEKVRGAIAATDGAPLVYRFGPDARMPLLEMGGRGGEAPVRADMLVVPRASVSPMTARLLSDSRAGDTARCEGIGGGVDGVRHDAEMFNPLEAWHRMGRPAFTITGNYFDVRGPGRGPHGCTAPMGIYYDSHPDSYRPDAAPWRGRFFPGTVGLTNGSSPWNSLSTLVIADTGPRTDITIHNPESPFTADGTARYLAGLEATGRGFVALSGPLLRGFNNPDWTIAHEPQPRADRTAIAYNPGADELYVVAGKHMTNLELQQLFRSLGADMAIGLDGGASQSFLVDKSAVRWDGQDAWGNRAPAGNCPNEPALYCNSTAFRPLASYLGLRFDPALRGATSGLPVPAALGSVQQLPPLPAGLQWPVMPPMPELPFPVTGS